MWTIGSQLRSRTDRNAIVCLRGCILHASKTDPSSAKKRRSCSNKRIRALQGVRPARAKPSICNPNKQLLHLRRGSRANGSYIYEVKWDFTRCRGKMQGTSLYAACLCHFENWLQCKVRSFFSRRGINLVYFQFYRYIFYLSVTLRSD